jgi:hypothetical protein
MNMPNDRPRTVTRKELYELVWGTPMARLAEEFGVSGNGLAKACRRLQVPYPPRGYWAKKEAGKPVGRTKLPRARSDTLASTEIRPSPVDASPKKSEPPNTTALSAAALVTGLAVPERTTKLHPLIQGWIEQHRREQKEQEHDDERLGFAIFGPLPDLTERDIYRFRVTSALLTGVEKAGGETVAAPIDGKLVFSVSDHVIECSVVEKMEQSLKPREKRKAWTAYPGHHRSDLASTGFLRVTIKTWLGGRKPQWVETERRKMSNLLPEIVGEIIATAPALERLDREREEWQQKRREEEEARRDAQRQKELDEKRWQLFRDLASDWEEHALLQRFLADIETRLDGGADHNFPVGDRRAREWLGWARDRAARLDPLREGASGLFRSLSEITPWSS